MQIRNATKEKFRIQCESRVFDFDPDVDARMLNGKTSTTEIPIHLLEYIMGMVKEKGCFIVYPGMNEEAIKAARLEALDNYLNGALSTRIKNYVSEQDDFKKKGVTFLGDKNYDRAVRWQGELKQILKDNDFVERELSFLEDKKSEEKKENRSLKVS